MNDLALARRLVEWYWQSGFTRGRPALNDADRSDRAKYDLPAAQWLARLYDVCERLADYRVAARRRRPAIAFWGLSQTGKSTALSFVNGSSEPTGDPATDGIGSGLHWPGGTPFAYQSPYRKDGNYPLHWSRRIYNPYNTGDDASSCLTRLVAVAPGGEVSELGIQDTVHPVRIRLLRPIELLTTLARGYDSQCWGPGPAGKQRPWTPEALELTLGKVRSRFPEPDGRIEFSRVAFEQVHLLSGALLELYALGLETYATAAVDETAWRGWIEARLLDSALFTSNLQAAEAVTAALLWGGVDPITVRFRQLRGLQEDLAQRWGDVQELHASLEVAMLLIDMSSGVNAFQRWPADTKQGVQAELVAGLGARREGGLVKLGCGPDYPEKLGGSAEAYANFQSLVYEIVLAVNLEHLPDGTPRRLLAQADILDFPGVGREAVNEHTRINFQATEKRAGQGVPFSAADFYSRIFKRGKTASIVANYARRMNIDEFAILQSLDGKELPSEGMVAQILEGCRAWRRYAGFDDPDYQTKHGGRLPLSFVLTFWGSKIQSFSPTNALNFTSSVTKVYSAYGPLASGEVVHAFALNYHHFKSANVDIGDFAVGSPTYEKVVAEPAFREFFREGVSRQSFDAMITDRATGGLTFFFDQLGARLSAIDASWRQRRLERLIGSENEALAALLAWPDLRRPTIVRDERAEILADFRQRLIAGAAAADEGRMAAVSHVLRTMLNVDSETLPQPPEDPEAFTAAQAERCFAAWKEQVLRGYVEWTSRGGKGEPDWSHLQLRGREELAALLQALIDALGERTFTAVADATRRRMELMDTLPRDLRAWQARRAIAVEVTNRLVYLNPAEPEYPRRTTDDDAGGPPLRGPEERARLPGLATQAYRGFVGPFFDRQLAALLRHLAPKRVRPDLPGDAELEELLAGAASRDPAAAAAAPSVFA